MSSHSPLEDRLWAMQSWEQVNRLLVISSKNAATLAELAALGIYHYHLLKAFGQLNDGAVAQRLLTKLAAQLPQQIDSIRSAHYVDHACAIAWLSQKLESVSLSVPSVTLSLAKLDQALLPIALRLQKQPPSQSRHAFFRIVRYFSLRLPAPIPLAAIHKLLTAHSLAHFRLVGHQPHSLGLSDGLASELLTIMPLMNLGIVDQCLQHYVREKVQWLLALKQAIDFSCQRYAMFPYKVRRVSQEPKFSTELSWRRGDMGQALVLYNASSFFADTELAELAELVGLNTLLRVTPEMTSIKGAAFERGAAGVAQLYFRLYAASNHLPKYHEGYLFWLQETQRWLSRELATDFYSAREASLRAGLPGVALVLLAEAANTGHDWDSLLL